jgi:hypothetical protein
MERHLLPANARERHLVIAPLQLPQYRATQNITALFTGKNTDVLRSIH